MHGNSTRRGKSATSKQPKKAVNKPAKKDRDPKVRHARLSSIQRSPENDKLYRPVDPTDPDIVALAESIREHGIREPLIITADSFIVSGHRRFTAARVAGLKTVPVIQLSIRRVDDLEGFVRLLREHNRQREKTNAEKLREEVVSINPTEAYTELRKYRRSAAVLTVTPLEIGDIKCRKSGLRPAATGWFGHEKPFAFEPGPIRYADSRWRMIGGTPAIPALYTALAGWETILEAGVEAIRKKSLRQTTLLRSLVRERGFSVNTPEADHERGGTICFDFDGAEAVSKALLSRDMLHDYRPRCGIRASPHFYTTDEELERFVRAIDEIRKR